MESSSEFSLHLQFFDAQLLFGFSPPRHVAMTTALHKIQRSDNTAAALERGSRLIKVEIVAQRDYWRLMTLLWAPQSKFLKIMVIK